MDNFDFKAAQIEPDFIRWISNQMKSPTFTQSGDFVIKSIESATISYTDENGEEHIRKLGTPIKSESEEADESIFTPEFISKVDDISLELSGKYELV